MVSPEYIERAEKKSAEIRASIKTMKLLGKTDEETKDILVKMYNITPGYAQNWLDAIAEEEEAEVIV